MEDVLQTSDQLCGPPLNSIQQTHVLLTLAASELKVVSQVGAHKGGVEGRNHAPQPAG